MEQIQTPCLSVWASGRTAAVDSVSHSGSRFAAPPVLNRRSQSGPNLHAGRSATGCTASVPDSLSLYRRGMEARYRCRPLPLFLACLRPGPSGLKLAWNNLPTPDLRRERGPFSSGLFRRHERQAEVPRLALQVLDLAVAALRLHRRQVLLDVFLATGRHGVCQPGQLMGGGLDRLGGVHAREATAMGRADGSLAVASGSRRHTQRLADPVGLSRRRAAQLLVAADARPGRQTQPRAEVRRRGKARQVRPDLRGDRQGRLARADMESAVRRAGCGARAARLRRTRIAHYASPAGR